MTTSEMQTARDALYAQYLAWIGAGCPASYTINGRTVTKVDANFWLTQIGQLDTAIASASRGAFGAATIRGMR